MVKDKQNSTFSIGTLYQHDILEGLDLILLVTHNVLVKDITTHDIRQLGFFATKVYIPQLIPLAGSYKYYYYGGKRLYEVPTKFGYKSHNFNNLNPFPHPFP